MNHIFVKNRFKPRKARWLLKPEGITSNHLEQKQSYENGNIWSYEHATSWNWYSPVIIWLCVH